MKPIIKPPSLLRVVSHLKAERLAKPVPPPEPQRKVCQRCFKKKDITEFHRRRKKGPRSSRCKVCTAADIREWRHRKKREASVMPPE